MTIQKTASVAKIMLLVLVSFLLIASQGCFKPNGQKIALKLEKNCASIKKSQEVQSKMVEIARISQEFDSLKQSAQAILAESEKQYSAGLSRYTDSKNKPTIEENYSRLGQLDRVNERLSDVSSLRAEMYKKQIEIALLTKGIDSIYTTRMAPLFTEAEKSALLEKCNAERFMLRNYLKADSTKHFEGIQFSDSAFINHIIFCFRNHEK